MTWKRAVGLVLVVVLSAGLAMAQEKKDELGTPKLIKKVNPAYPEDAKKAGIMGEVILEAVISEKGMPLEVKVKTSPNESLSKAAIAAVQQWEWEPVRLKDGTPQKVKVSLTVNFKLK